MAASVGDQGVSALTNIAVVVFAARQSTARDFADFAVVYTVFTVLLGAATAYVGQALVLRRGPRTAGHCRGSALFTLAASAAIGAALLPAALLTGGGIGGGVGGGLAALGLVLPVVLTQDALRYGFSVLGRPQLALAADLLRLACAVPALALQPYGSSPGRLVLVWGLSAVPALLLGGALLLRATRGAPPAPLRGLLGRQHLGRRFVVEFGVGNAGTQLAVIWLGVLADPLAVGALRGASTLFGPMNVLFNATTGFGPPLLGRIAGPRRQARATALAGVALAGTAALWATALALLPGAAGRQLLGDTWSAAAGLLPATGSQYAAMAVGVCGLLTLRVLAPRTTLPLQVVFSLLSVGLLLGGYALGGVLGAAWGLCAGSAAKALATRLRIRALLRPPAPPPPGGTAPGPGGRTTARRDAAPHGTAGAEDGRGAGA
ncbi:hypothetical protein [Streptomyces aidingensis]|uniref:Membrane protein involved in the export of O-antigen and teichoic acid n=1 Tax=Streptomyces aidingensis TaxID=910347 RepID=A0A1I1LDT0_9ACTN|nr:hypothetical protein [Streptomyces aidingensis]SFC68543.1 Membrane protein involved in the export of O-antigen and teichoic acid [Streptomyces aidingensis]